MIFDKKNLDLFNEMKSWRHHFHQFPETAFEEIGTAQFISSKLKDFGFQVIEGVAKTGIVASLTRGNSTKSIALRADMDALFIHEQNNLPYKSKHDGKMHACGHDGHSAMLLGAAKYLAKFGDFNGTVYLIFQPAEEGRAGAKKMIEEGLFRRFSIDSVYGLHNFPDIPAGHFAVKSGSMMASFDCFEIKITGQATHAAMPHLGNDVFLAASQLVQATQSIVSRNIDPAESAVVSITQIHGGNTWNAIPDKVTLRGTYRCFSYNIQRLIESRLKKIVNSSVDCFNLKAEILFNPENPGYPILKNSEPETNIAIQVAEELVGTQNVQVNPTPSMGSEDFAFMLQEKPGCYIWLGNGSSANSCLLHNPHYDFNDDILTTGASYWINLVNKVLC